MYNAPAFGQLFLVGLTLILTFAGRQELMKDETKVCGSSDMKESLGNQMGAAIAMLIFVMICQVFFLADDLGMVQVPSTGMFAAASFDIFRMGLVAFCEITRALALVFLVGASYQVDASGSAKGLLVTATIMLLVELIISKFELGHAICDNWYTTRKRQQRQGPGTGRRVEGGGGGAAVPATSPAMTAAA